MTIGVVVLAAGMARRMGESKLTLPLGGKPVLRHTLDHVAAAGLPALLVTGGHYASVADIAGDTPSIHAEDHANGIGHSIAAGIAAVPRAWTAALILPGDMPWVRPDTLRRIAESLDGDCACLPFHDGKRGNPAGFGRAFFPSLIALSGDRGARDLLSAAPNLRHVLVDDPGIHQDIDTAGDLLRAPPA